MLCAVLSLGLLLLELQIGIKGLMSLQFGKEFMSGESARKQRGLWQMAFGWTVILNSAQQVYIFNHFLFN
jgi:hypothetical protein